MTVTVEIEFTDRTRHADRTFVIDTAFAIVEADTETEATLVAHDMTRALIPRDSMVTATRILDIDNV
jgi:hypothetical protein